MGEDNGFDESEASELAIQPAYAYLLVDIVGHPAGAPSIAELDYTNPSTERDVIRTRIQHLQDAGIISEIVLNADDHAAEYPHQFYQLTDPARDLFEEWDSFRVTLGVERTTASKSPPKSRTSSLCLVLNHSTTAGSAARYLPALGPKIH